MSRMWWDEAPDVERRMSARGEIDRLSALGGRASQETENRFDRVRDHIDRSSDEPRWREEHLDLVRALLRSALGDVDDAGGAQDMSPDAIAARITDPARSRLNVLTRGVPNPNRHIR
jgi:hypothetical protein